jgi:hypothetical protein
VVALATQIPHTVWLDDPRALATAMEILEEQERKAKRRR